MKKITSLLQNRFLREVFTECERKEEKENSSTLYLLGRNGVQFKH